MMTFDHCEGELYKVYTIDCYTFEIRYGYYDEKERGRIEPLPIFPDLMANPIYSLDGERIVTAIQLPCQHYQPMDSHAPEEWCGDCKHYANGTFEIGLCRCSQQQRYPTMEDPCLLSPINCIHDTQRANT